MSAHPIGEEKMTSWGAFWMFMLCSVVCGVFTAVAAERPIAGFAVYFFLQSLKWLASSYLIKSQG